MAQNQPNPNYESKFLGALLGLAVGDALGSPVEGKSRREIEQEFGGQRVKDYMPSKLLEFDDETLLPYTVPLPPGSYTDDTDQMLIHAVSIIETGGKVEPLDFGPRFVQALDGPKSSFIGRTSSISLLQIQESGDYQGGIDHPQAAGNGVAMRIAPLGLLHTYGQFNRENFLRDCEVAARITHGNRLAIQGGIAVATAVRLLCLQSIMPEDLMGAALDMLPPDPPFENRLRYKLIAAQDYIEERQTLVDNVRAGDLSDVDLFEIDLNNMERAGVSGYVAESVAAAFYAFAAYKDSFEDAVILAVNAGGDADTIAAMTGAMAGAYHGVEAIPQRWLDGLENRAYIEDVARRLHKTVRSRELTDYNATGI